MTTGTENRRSADLSSNTMLSTYSNSRKCILYREYPLSALLRSLSVLSTRADTRQWILPWRHAGLCSVRSFRSSSRSISSPLYSTKHKCIPRKASSSKIQNIRDESIIRGGIAGDRVVSEMTKIAYKLKRDQWLKKAPVILEETQMQNKFSLVETPPFKSINQLSNKKPCDLLGESKNLKDLKKRIRQTKGDTKVSFERVKRGSSINSEINFPKTKRAKIDRKDSEVPSEDAKAPLPSPYFFIHQSLNRESLKTTFTCPKTDNTNKTAKAEIKEKEDLKPEVDFNKNIPSPRLITQNNLKTNPSNKEIELKVNSTLSSVTKNIKDEKSVSPTVTKNEKIASKRNEDYPSPSLNSVNSSLLKDNISNTWPAEFTASNIINVPGQLSNSISNKSAIVSDNFLRNTDKHIRRKISSMKLSKEIIIFKDETNKNSLSKRSKDFPSKEFKVIKNKNCSDDIQKSNFSSLTQTGVDKITGKNQSCTALVTTITTCSNRLAPESTEKSNKINLENTKRVKELCEVLTATSKSLENVLKDNTLSPEDRAVEKPSNNGKCEAVYHTRLPSDKIMYHIFTKRMPVEVRAINRKSIVDISKEPEVIDKSKKHSQPREKHLQQEVENVLSESSQKNPLSSNNLKFEDLQVKPSEKNRGNPSISESNGSKVDSKVSEESDKKNSTDKIKRIKNPLNPILSTDLTSGEKDKQINVSKYNYAAQIAMKLKANNCNSSNNCCLSTDLKKTKSKNDNWSGNLNEVKENSNLKREEENTVSACDSSASDTHLKADFSKAATKQTFLPPALKDLIQSVNTITGYLGQQSKLNSKTLKTDKIAVEAGKNDSLVSESSQTNYPVTDLQNSGVNRIDQTISSTTRPVAQTQYYQTQDICNYQFDATACTPDVGTSQKYSDPVPGDLSARNNQLNPNHNNPNALHYPYHKQSNFYSSDDFARQAQDFQTAQPNTKDYYDGRQIESSKPAREQTNYHFQKSSSNTAILHPYTSNNLCNNVNNEKVNINNNYSYKNLSVTDNRTIDSILMSSQQLAGYEQYSSPVCTQMKNQQSYQEFPESFLLAPKENTVNNCYSCQNEANEKQNLNEFYSSSNTGYLRSNALQYNNQTSLNDISDTKKASFYYNLPAEHHDSPAPAFSLNKVYGNKPQSQCTLSMAEPTFCQGKDVENPSVLYWYPQRSPQDYFSNSTYDRPKTKRNDYFTAKHLQSLSRKAYRDYLTSNPPCHEGYCRATNHETIPQLKLYRKVRENEPYSKPSSIPPAFSSICSPSFPVNLMVDETKENNSHVDPSTKLKNLETEKMEKFEVGGHRHPEIRVVDGKSRKTGDSVINYTISEEPHKSLETLKGLVAQLLKDKKSELENKKKFNEIMVSKPDTSVPEEKVSTESGEALIKTVSKHTLLEENNCKSLSNSFYHLGQAKTYLEKVLENVGVKTEKITSLQDTVASQQSLDGAKILSSNNFLSKYKQKLGRSKTVVENVNEPIDALTDKIASPNILSKTVDENLNKQTRPTILLTNVKEKIEGNTIEGNMITNKSESAVTYTNVLDSQQYDLNRVTQPNHKQTKPRVSVSVDNTPSPSMLTLPIVNQELSNNTSKFDQVEKVLKGTNQTSLMYPFVAAEEKSQLPNMLEYKPAQSVPHFQSNISSHPHVYYDQSKQLYTNVNLASNIDSIPQYAVTDTSESSTIHTQLVAGKSLINETPASDKQAPILQSENPTWTFERKNHIQPATATHSAQSQFRSNEAQTNYQPTDVRSSNNRSKEAYYNADSTGAIDSIPPNIFSDAGSADQFLFPKLPENNHYASDRNQNKSKIQVFSLAESLRHGMKVQSSDCNSVFRKSYRSNVQGARNSTDFVNDPLNRENIDSKARRTDSEAVAESLKAVRSTDPIPPEFNVKNIKEGKEENVSRLQGIKKNLSDYLQKFWKNPEDKFLENHPAYPDTKEYFKDHKNINDYSDKLNPPNPFNNMKKPLSPIMDKLNADGSYVMNMLVDNPIKSFRKAAFARRVKTNSPDIGLCSTCMKISQLSTDFQRGMPFLRNQKMNYNRSDQKSKNDAEENSNKAREIYDNTKYNYTGIPQSPINDTIARTNERVKGGFYSYRKPPVNKKREITDDSNRPMIAPARSKLINLVKNPALAPVHDKSLSTVLYSKKNSEATQIKSKPVTYISTSNNLQLWKNKVNANIRSSSVSKKTKKNPYRAFSDIYN